ncbi:unnamed protein product [Lampetra planeri]
MGNMMRGGSAREQITRGTLDSSPKSSEDMMAVVLQDYPSSQISRPMYRKGERLSVIAQDTYWWRVRSLQTGKENYLPNSHVAKVYHGWLFEGVGRQKAEELLLLPGNRVGSFLVRECARERGAYALSVKHRTIRHYRIFRLDNSWYYISPRLTFQCLEDMINHYSAGQGTDSHSDSIVSYGVRNSIATYLSFSGNQDPAQMRADNRKKKE